MLNMNSKLNITILKHSKKQLLRIEFLSHVNFACWKWCVAKPF